MSIQAVNTFQNNTNYYNKTVIQPNFQGAESKQIDGPKQGMSSTAKWVIGLGLTALAAGGIYLATKGKVKPQSFKEIQFQEAKTVEEAKKFAEDKLGVILNKEEQANLDMMNTVNRWLFIEKKSGGKIPDIISFENDRGILNPLAMTNPINYDNNKKFNALLVNTKYIDKFDDVIEEIFKKENGIDITKLISNQNGVYKIADSRYNCENLEKLVNLLNEYNKNSTYKEKMTIYEGFSSAIGYLSNIQAGNNIKMRNFSDNLSFLHEIGHLRHQDAYIHYNDAINTASDIYKEFIEPKNQKIANKVTDYACESPLEFVAEVYKYLRNGEKFDDDVMDLYRKYKGPEV